jgi:hypothetical protein
MTRRPPAPDRPVKGGMVVWSPSRRPTGHVEASAIEDRVPWREALRRVAALYADPRAASDALVRLVMTDQLPITCEQLRYDGVPGHGPISYQWPGSSANLAKQMARAHGSAMSFFTLDAVAGDVQWVDLHSGPVMNAYAIGLHVDGEALARRFGLNAPTSAAGFAPPVAPEAAPVADNPAPQAERDQTLRQFVLACIEDGIKAHTVAYRDRFKPAQAAGRFPGKSRRQFEAAYKEHYPNPKPGPAAGE